MIVAVGLATVVVLAGCGGSRTKQPIEPGRSIGTAKLFETREAAETTLGQPDKVSVISYPVGPPDVRAVYNRSGLNVVYSGTGQRAKVGAIWTTDPRYETQQGLKVGTPMSKVRELLRGSKCSHTGTSCQLQSGPHRFTGVEGTRGGDVTQIDILASLG